jgi:hypothetical protein
VTESYPELPPPVQLEAVCHSDGCPVEGQAFPGFYYPVGDFDPPRYMGQCGRCQQPITDLRPAITPDPVPAPEEATAPAPVPVEPSVD